MRRHEEMQARNALRMLQAFGDFTDQKVRGVAGQRNVRFCQRFNFGKQFLFQRQVFGRGVLADGLITCTVQPCAAKTVAISPPMMPPPMITAFCLDADIFILALGAVGAGNPAYSVGSIDYIARRTRAKACPREGRLRSRT